jgi:hypothetical protein
MALAAGAIGVYGPLTPNKAILRLSLPDALDLLTVCVEAGSGLDQAIARTTEDLNIPHPALSDELRKITTEVRAGIPRAQALKNFAARTGVDDVRTFQMLSQRTVSGRVPDAARSCRYVPNAEAVRRGMGRKGRCRFHFLAPVCFRAYVVLGPVVVIYRTFIVGQANEREFNEYQRLSRSPRLSLVLRMSPGGSHASAATTGLASLMEGRDRADLRLSVLAVVVLSASCGL